MCHIVNLVAQATLATLGEANNPDETNYYALNKGQPLHLDIDTDLDQIELDREVFQNDAEDKTSLENIVLEDEEKLKATESALFKVCVLAVKFSYSGPLMFVLAMLHYIQNCLITPVMEEVSKMHNLNILQEKLGSQGQERGPGSGSRCPYMLELYTCNDPSSRAPTRSQSQTNQLFFISHMSLVLWSTLVSWSTSIFIPSCIHP